MRSAYAAPLAPTIGTVDVTVNDESGLIAAIAAAPADGATQYVIAVNGTIELTARLNIPANTNIALTGGGTLSGTATFDTTGEVNVVGNLILGNITITHDAGVSGRGIYISSGGQVDMLDGARVSGNSYNGTIGGYGVGAGVAIDAGVAPTASASFNMWGGTVTDNHATGAGVAGDGGGVYVGRGTGAVFTMYGGSITKNTGIVGSAVFFGLSGGTFIMNGGTISDNTSTGEGTVGMYGANTTFTMNDGVIENNTAVNGGGVAVIDGQDGIKTFTMTGGSITNNTASNVGGGIEIAPGGGVGATETVTITGGAISNNNALNGGGIGLLSAGGTFTALAPRITLSGGMISGNVATNNGGGIYGIGGTITGGVEIDMITVSGATIQGNSAINGGGIYNAIDSQITITAGTLTGNTATADGGGIYTVDYTKLSVSADAVFSNNTAVAASTRNPVDDALYMAQVAGTSWTEPFEQGYNNFDINYNGGTSLQVVWFDTNGGSAIAPLAVNSATPVAKPDDPVRDGYMFKGWYTDNTTFIDAYDFSLPVSENLTLHAQWEEVIELLPPTGDRGGMFMLGALCLGFVSILAGSLMRGSRHS